RWHRGRPERRRGRPPDPAPPVVTAIARGPAHGPHGPGRPAAGPRRSAGRPAPRPGRPSAVPLEHRWDPLSARWEREGALLMVLINPPSSPRRRQHHLVVPIRAGHRGTGAGAEGCLRRREVSGPTVTGTAAHGRAAALRRFARRGRSPWAQDVNRRTGRP